MPYIGRPLQAGVRRRYIYAATAGQTSFSGNDSNGISLAYDDSLFLDVYQNGVLLKPVTDYASTTGTSVVLTTGASTDDVLEMLVFDTFGVADTVSAKDGGSFAGAVSFGNGASVTGALTTTAGATIADGDLLLDGGSPEIIFQTAASHYNWMIAAQENVSNALEISSGGQDADYSNDTWTTRLVVRNNGEVTTPTQPSFMAYPDGNIAVSNSTSLSTFAANTEIYDVGSNYNTSTYKFVAPVTGRYLIKWAFRLDSSDSGATYYYYRIYTSNRAYDQIVKPTADETYTNPHNIAIVDLDANDEAYLQYQQYSGTNNHATIVSNSGLTYIQGMLIG